MNILNFDFESFFLIGFLFFISFKYLGLLYSNKYLFYILAT